MIFPNAQNQEKLPFFRFFFQLIDICEKNCRMLLRKFVKKNVVNSLKDSEPKSKKLKKSLNHRQSNHNILKKLENFDGGFWKDEEVTLEASTINHLRQLKRDQADVSIPKQESTKTNVSVLGIIRKYCLSQWKSSTSIFQSS